MYLSVVTYAQQYLKLTEDLPVQLECGTFHTKHSGKEPPLFVSPEVLYSCLHQGTDPTEKKGHLT